MIKLIGFNNRVKRKSHREFHLYNFFAICDAPAMLKRFLPFLGFLLLTGCTSVLTNLTPQTQVRNTNNLYTVEVSMASRQQTLRWDSIKPQILVGTEVYQMRPTLLMTNRWEGLIPVSPGTRLSIPSEFWTDPNSPHTSRRRTEAKAAWGCRTPRRWREFQSAAISARFCSGAGLCRFCCSNR
jgi:hypothetical protein